MTLIFIKIAEFKINIFYLDADPKIAASFHCDKHVVKMILETAQLLSTAHRILDGKCLSKKSKTDRTVKYWMHPDSNKNDLLYQATHVNHPSAVWVRQSKDNYLWAYNLMIELNNEFIKRYNKTEDHLTIKKLKHLLCEPPNALIKNPGYFSHPPCCMPEQYKDKTSAINSYKNYYIHGKKDIAVWKVPGTMPTWYDSNITFIDGHRLYDDDNLQ